MSAPHMKARVERRATMCRLIARCGTRLIACAIVAFIGCGSRPDSAPRAATAPGEFTGLVEKVGWYRLPAGDTALLTYSARGGLRLFSLADSLYWVTLVPVGERLHWSAPDGPVVEFQRTNGVTTSFTWTDAAHGARAAARIVGHGYAVEEQMVVRNGVRLSATLFLPRDTGLPVPAVVMIHGSGESDRDNAWYMMIADALVRSGIAVLLPDKRGSGKSEGDWRTADLSELAGDAVAQLQSLRAHANIDSARTGLIGLSQGGRVAPMAAGATEVAFVIDVSGAAVPLHDQLVHEVRQDMKRDRLPGILDPVVLRISLSRIRGRQPQWWQTNGPIDPLDYWRAIDVPALVVYGADDETDNVPVRRSVERLQSLGKQNLDVWVFDGSGHALWEPEEWGGAQQDGRRRVRRDFLERLAAWIHRAT